MIDVSLQFKTIDEAIVALGKLVSAGGVAASAGSKVAPAPSAETSTNKRGRGRPRKPSAPAQPSTATVFAAPSKEGVGQGDVAPEAEPNAAPTVAGQESAPSSAPSEAAPSADDAKKALENWFVKHGNDVDGARALLQQFGCERLRDLPADKRAAFIAHCEAAK